MQQDLSGLSNDQLLQELQSALQGGNSTAPAPAQAPSAPTPNDMVLSSVNRGGVTSENLNADVRKKEIDNAAALDLERQKKGMEGVGSGESGRVALAKESLINIDEVLKTLFPDGTPKSFRRDIAFGSNVPFSEAPIVGRVIPNNIPIGKEGPTVSRDMGDALAGKQLIQTGVAARPDETAKLIANFAPNFFSNPEAAFEGLGRLKDFYKTYLKTVDPQGVKGANVPEKTGVTKSGVSYKILQ